ncbi:MAG: Na+/H+ antiporter NhaC family protein, partial [Bacilli bacterium]
IANMGGTAAFADWATSRVRTRRGAQWLTVGLGILIFIDDYFNSLTVGAVSRPITDRYGVSRAKLAYLIDSTSAPICVIAPVSSWGAYIIGLLGAILAGYGLADKSELVTFIKMVPLNFYVLFTFAVVAATIHWNMNFGKMKVYEEREQQVSNDEGVKAATTGRVSDLIVPIVTLVVSTFVMMFLTGLRNNDWTLSIFGILENADVYLSLFIASLISLSVVLVSAFRRPNVARATIGQALITGAGSMQHAVVILISAWMLTDFISQLGTGAFVAEVFQSWNVSAQWMPAIIFVISAVMAFATGTSWGTFGLMLPIAAQMIMVSDPTWILPALAAVLAGAVCGDHCSPISDTTILSSTGAQCDHIEHVDSQLPYALLSASITFVAYVVLGLTSSYWLALLAGVVLFAALIRLITTRTRVLAAE